MLKESTEAWNQCLVNLLHWCKRAFQNDLLVHLWSSFLANQRCCTTERFTPENDLYFFSTALLSNFIAEVTSDRLNVSAECICCIFTSITRRKASICKGDDISFELKAELSEKLDLMRQKDSRAVHILNHALPLPTVLLPILTIILQMISSQHESILSLHLYVE